MSFHYYCFSVDVAYQFRLEIWIRVKGLSDIYLRPKVTLHFSVANISTLILILSKLNISMISHHMPKLSS